MKQHTPIVNLNYFSKCSLMHNQNFDSNKNMLVVIIEQKVVAPLIPKEMENHLNIW
jgi:hypothetical protein